MLTSVCFWDSGRCSVHPLWHYRYIDMWRTSSQYECCSIQLDWSFLNISRCKRGKKNIFLCCEVTEKAEAGSLYKNCTFCPHISAPSRRKKALKVVSEREREREYQALGRSSFTPTLKRFLKGTHGYDKENRVVVGTSVGRWHRESQYSAGGWVTAHCMWSVGYSQRSVRQPAQCRWLGKGTLHVVCGLQSAVWQTASTVQVAG